MEKLVLPDLKKPSQEELNAIRDKELECIKEQGEQIDTRTILGRLQREKLLLEYKYIEEGKELSHNVFHIDKETGMKYIHNELTQYGKVCNNIKLLKQSKLMNHSMFNDFQLDRFDDRTPFSVDIKKKATEFINDPQRLFMVSGKSGIGKSHICTAIATELLLKGNEVAYMLWVDEVARIKYTQDLAERQYMMNYYKNAEVLYIDDLLKVNKNQIEKINDVDKRIAIEIIFSRYMSKKTTIISTELSLNKLFDIDEAMASRLVEMGGSYLIEKKEGKNERL